MMVENVMGALFSNDRPALVSPTCPYDRKPGGSRHLHRRYSHAPSCAVHKQRFARPGCGALKEATISRHVWNADRSALLECHLSRQALHLALRAQSLLCVGAAD